MALKEYKLLLFFIFILAGQVFCQQYNFENFSIEHGLAQSQAYDIMQDSRGYIWVATDGGGVSRFDGLHFSNLTTGDGLVENTIRSIFEDRDNTIWIGTKGGHLMKYDGVRVTKVLDGKTMDYSAIYAIEQDCSGNIFFGTNKKGLYKLKDGKPELVNLMGNGDELSILSLKLNPKDGALYIGTSDHGLIKYFGNAVTFYSIKEGMPSRKVNAIWRDSFDQIWVGTDMGVAKKDTNDIFQTYSLEDGLCGLQISSICQDKSGDMWFGSSFNGISRWRDETFTTFDTKKGLFYNNVLSICCDNNNNIWIGTDGGGISKFKGELFKHLTEEDGMPGKIVMSMTKDKSGNFWFGTYGNGACMYNGESFSYYSKENGLCSDLIYCIKEDSQYNMWFGSKGGGVSVFDGKRFVNYDERSLGSNFIYSIIEDNDKNIWFGTLGSGITIFNGKTFTNIDKNNGLCSNFIYKIFQDSKGNIWMGTDDVGVFMIFGTWNSDNIIETGRIPENEIINITKYGLVNKQVLSIVEDKFGNIWIGTFGGGVTKFDGVTLKNFSEKHGLNSNNIYLLLFDSQGYLWAGTEKGLNRIDIRKNEDQPQIKKYSGSEGFRGIETNFNSTLEDNNGNLWFGNLGGATMYSPSKDIQNQIEPITTITGVKLFYKDIDWSLYSDNLSAWGGVPGSFELPYYLNHLTFEFVGIDHKSPENVQYEWFLEGFDKNWSPRSAKREVTYQNIPPGEYTFMLKAYNSDNIGNKDSSTIHFNIPPPFWQTTWFYLVCVVLFGGFVLTIIRLRLRKLEKEKKILEEKVMLRTLDLQNEKAIVESQTKDLKVKTDQLELVNEELFMLSLVASKTDNAIIICDKDGNFVWVNEGFSRMFGYSLDQIISKSPTIIGADTPENIRSIIRLAFEKKETVNYEFHAGTKDGRKIWVYVTLTPIMDSDGQIKNIIAIDSDVTKLKEAEEQANQQRIEIQEQRDKLSDTLDKLKNAQKQLVESEKMASLGTLVAGVAHEINTPVGVSITANSLILENVKELAKKFEANQLSSEIFMKKMDSLFNCGKLIEDNLNRAAELVKNFKQVSVDHASENFRNFNFKEYVNGIINSLQSELRGYDIKIEAVGNPQLSISSFPGLFAQIVTNLILNSKIHAFKETHKGSIRIEYSCEGEIFRMSYKDDGLGMKKEDLKSVFEPFFTTDKQKGSGLGMHIVFNLISQTLNGTIHCESERGKGFLVNIEVPIQKGKLEVLT